MPNKLNDKTLSLKIVTTVKAPKQAVLTLLTNSEHRQKWDGLLQKFEFK